MEAYQFIPHFLFAGGKQVCNICGFKGRFYSWRGSRHKIIDLLQIIGAGRRAVDCLKCGSSDRDRLVYHYLTENKAQLLNKQEGLFQILHIAPEKALSKALERDFLAQIIRIDKRAKGYRNSYDATVQTGDICALNFGDEQFQLIVCNHVLEHVADVAKAMRELHRVLKAGGLAILQVPIALKSQKTIEAQDHWSKKQRQQLLGQWDHLRLYAMDYFDKLAVHGFEVKAWHPTSEAIQKHRLDAQEFLVLAHKSN